VGTELRDTPSLLTVEESLEELERLADKAGIDVVGMTFQRLDKPNPATYIGPGKVEEIHALVEELGESSVKVVLTFWHEPDIASEWAVRDAVVRAAVAALDREGIEIPFPHRVVRLKGDRGGGLPD
jgi:small-conductance mechanosensitive channel